jgi:hypothetical protein
MSIVEWVVLGVLLILVVGTLVILFSSALGIGTFVPQFIMKSSLPTIEWTRDDLGEEAYSDLRAKVRGEFFQTIDEDALGLCFCHVGHNHCGRTMVKVFLQAEVIAVSSDDKRRTVSYRDTGIEVCRDIRCGYHTRSNMCHRVVSCNVT